MNWAELLSLTSRCLNPILEHADTRNIFTPIFRLILPQNVVLDFYIWGSISSPHFQPPTPPLTPRIPTPAPSPFLHFMSVSLRSWRIKGGGREGGNRKKKKAGKKGRRGLGERGSSFFLPSPPPPNDLSLFFSFFFFLFHKSPPSLFMRLLRRLYRLCPLKPTLL